MPTVLTRHRLSIIGTIVITAAGTIYLLWSSTSGSSTSSALHRSNAIRRAHRSTDEPEDGADTQDDRVTDVSIQDEDADIVSADQTAQQFHEVVFAIHENQARQEGIKHRGFQCDNCGEIPIVGVRYKCSSCFDFDLCEKCEAAEPHYPTHVFYKVRIPMPWAFRKGPPNFYPGLPHLMPPELSYAEKCKLVKQLKKYDIECTVNEVAGQYTQFKSLATHKDAEQLPSPTHMGITRRVFDESFIPRPAGKPMKAPTLLHDRVFAFYDIDKDALISLDEFIIGNFLISREGKEERRKRIFAAVDLNDDSYISRADFLLLFRARYDLNKQIILHEFELQEHCEEDADIANSATGPSQLVASGRSLASHFPESDRQYPGPQASGQGKSRDENGDLVPDRSQGVETVPEDRNDLIVPEDATSGSWVDSTDWEPLELYILECIISPSYNRKRHCHGRVLDNSNSKIFIGESTKSSQKEVVHILWTPRMHLSVRGMPYLELDFDEVQVTGETWETVQQRLRERFVDRIDLLHGRLQDALLRHISKLFREDRKQEDLRDRQNRQRLYDVSGDIAAEDAGRLESGPSMPSNEVQAQHGTDQSEKSNGTFQSLDALNDTNATRTIHNVSEAALGEILGDFFETQETKTVQAQLTAALRAKQAPLLRAFRYARDLVDQCRAQQHDSTEAVSIYPWNSKRKLPVITFLIALDKIGGDSRQVCAKLLEDGRAYYQHEMPIVMNLEHSIQLGLFGEDAKNDDEADQDDEADPGDEAAPDDGESPEPDPTMPQFRPPSDTVEHPNVDPQPEALAASTAETEPGEAGSVPDEDAEELGNSPTFLNDANQEPADMSDALEQLNAHMHRILPALTRIERIAADIAARESRMSDDNGVDQDPRAVTGDGTVEVEAIFTTSAAAQPAAPLNPEIVTEAAGSLQDEDEADALIPSAATAADDEQTEEPADEETALVTNTPMDRFWPTFLQLVNCLDELLEHENEVERATVRGGWELMSYEEFCERADELEVEGGKGEALVKVVEGWLSGIGF
ncbi:MAG: hypothetical protein M1831_003622 [Alyxoria varia]|nr:MAG: hypothetical protein M1831_003622 [Alyxoria varia]